MKLLEAYIENFGKLHKQTITFDDGINVILGANESGKSTLQEFITAMLFGMEQSRGRGKKEDIYRKYEPWNAASYYCGRLRFQIEEKPFCLTRNFYHKEKTADLVNEFDGEELSVAYGDLDVLLGHQTKSAYQNTWCIRQTKAATGKELADSLTEYLVNMENTGNADLSVEAAQKRLEKQRKELVSEKKEFQQKKQQRIEVLQIEKKLLEKDILSFKEQQALRNEKKERSEDENGKTQMKRKILKLTIFLVIVMVLHLFLKNLYPDFVRFLVVEGILLLGVMVTGIIFCLKCFSGKEAMERKKETAADDFYEEQIREKELRLMNVKESIEDAMAKTKKEVETEQKEQAILLAQQTINELTTEISADIRRQLFLEASDILQEITEGRYKKLFFDSNMEITMQSQDRTVPLGSLSIGTVDQVYLAVRIAVGRLLSEEPMFFSFDEAFHMYDEKRRIAVLRYLARQPEQSLIFSCDTKEIEALDSMGIAYHRIVLP